MKLRAFLRKFSTDEACRSHLESVRWPHGPVCDRCGVVGEAIPVEGRTGFWRCRACGKQFSVTAGTPMHGTHLPLPVWYAAMYLILASSKGISAVKLGEQLGVQYRTAWHLGHRIRAMLASGEKPPLAGLVEADETYVGGKSRNIRKGAPRPEKRGRGTLQGRRQVRVLRRDVDPPTQAHQGRSPSRRWRGLPAPTVTSRTRVPITSTRPLGIWWTPTKDLPWKTCPCAA